MAKKHVGTEETVDGHKKDKSQKVPQRDKLKHELNIYHRDDLTEKQKQYLEIILDKKTNIVFLNGCSGTSKTFLSLYAGLMAINAKTQSDILYLRSAIESASKSLGALPGDILEKVTPYLSPLHDKLEELLPSNEVTMLIKENRITGNVVNFIRGSSWNAKFIIVDESQNLNHLELKTIMTRLGKYSKLIILGDPSQSDLNSKSGFMPYFDLFNNDESKEYGIHCLSFTRQDIVRSKILGYILDRIEGTYTPHLYQESMFVK
jgi:phosphate starvation-inducible PhoH-like protein